MTRDQTRDKIRVEAGIPGDNMFDYLINTYINEELSMFTNLRRYPECQILGKQLSWESNVGATIFYGYAILPSDLQHFDVDSIYFYNGNDLNLIRPWTRPFINQTSGQAFQFRRATYQNATSLLYDQVLQITPDQEITFATNYIKIDYWRKLSWDDDTSNFPIPRLETTVALKATERIANLQNSGLAAKAAKLAMEHYTAERAVVTGAE